MIAVRGAITVDRDLQEEIYGATRELMTQIIDRNRLVPAEIVSVIFSCTSDIKSAYPAAEVRRMGLDVPLFCVQEMEVTGSLSKTIRVLVHVDRDKEWGAGVPKHVYLRKASALRPDLAVE